MATAFSRSLQALEGDRPVLATVSWLCAVLFLGGWGVWLLFGRVTLFEITEQARVEVATAVSPIQLPVTGRVLRSGLAIGRIVREGEILVELDASPQRLELAEQSAVLAGLTSEAEALRAQAAAEERAGAEDRLSSMLAADQAIAQERQAAAPAQYTSEELARLVELKRLGLIAERDYARGLAEAEQNRAAVAGSRIAVRRIEQEQRTRESERAARMRRLAAEIAALEGRMHAIRASMDRLIYEADRRVVRAYTTGRLGEAKDLRPGAVVSEGERIGAIVPDGQLRVVAWFPPPAAIGRLKPGQPARMRMHGYPWAQYGTLRATVSQVANEIREGRVRVELAAAQDSSRLPVQHGMPGVLEVDVDRVSPAALLLRLAGKWITRPEERTLVARENGGGSAR